jgi:hypothetical protein
LSILFEQLHYPCQAAAGFGVETMLLESELELIEPQLHGRHLHDGTLARPVCKPFAGFSVGTSRVFFA